MTVTIEDVTIVNEVANKLSVRSVSYQLDGENATAYYYLSNDTNGNLYNGDCKLSIDTVANWGVDDSVVLQDIATQKGFIIVRE